MGQAEKAPLGTVASDRRAPSSSEALLRLTDEGHRRRADDRPPATIIAHHDGPLPCTTTTLPRAEGGPVSHLTRAVGGGREYAAGRTAQRRDLRFLRGLLKSPK